jgi:hypothetical protein
MQWRIRPVARLAVGLTAAATALVAVPLTASAEAPASDWVATGTAPAGATIQTVAGTADSAGGCDFDLSGSLATSETILRMDEIAYSASTCQERVALTSGASAAPEAPDNSQAAVAASGSVTSALAGSTPPPGVAGVRHSAGYLRSWYTDPAGITVNSVRDDTNWHWNGRCVVAPVFGSFLYTWYNASGWSLHENNWQNTYSCSQSVSASYAHFYNGVFCIFDHTDVWYNRNTVNGESNGRLVGHVRHRKSGGCNGLLSFHSSLRRTL